MVPSGGGDFERALCPLLPLHLGEVAGEGGGGDLAGLGRGEGRAAGEMGDRLGERRGRDDRGGADPGGFGAAGPGADEAPPLFRCGHRRGQRAHHCHQRAVERELAQRNGSLNLVGRQHADRREQRQRDRQVEMRALLRHVGGRQVDRDALRRQRDRHRGEGGADPFLGLGHRLVGQAHHGEGGQARADRALHLHEMRLDALEGDGVGARDHVGSSGLPVPGCATGAALSNARLRDGEGAGGPASGRGGREAGEGVEGGPGGGVGERFVAAEGVAEAVDRAPDLQEMACRLA